MALLAVSMSTVTVLRAGSGPATRAPRVSRSRRSWSDRREGADHRTVEDHMDAAFAGPDGHGTTRQGGSEHELLIVRQQQPRPRRERRLASHGANILGRTDSG